nr:uncharacterized protein LOC121121728 [Lepeophtheirus salmonis]
MDSIFDINSRSQNCINPLCRSNKSPTGLVSQLGQNFVQWFSSSLFLTFLIPFNLAGNKRKLSRTKRSRGNGETLPWYFSMKRMSALMRAIADVADNYNRYKDEL